VILADLTGYRTVQNCIRVSILDLDDIAFFNRQTHGWSRKQPWHTLAVGPQSSSTELRCVAYSRNINNVVICISLYDVNSSDWTVKNCAQCLTVQSSVSYVDLGIGGA